MRIAGPKVRLLLVAAQRAGPASFGHKNTDRSLFNSPPGLAQVSPPGRALCVHLLPLACANARTALPVLLRAARYGRWLC